MQSCKAKDEKPRLRDHFLERLGVEHAKCERLAGLDLVTVWSFEFFKACQHKVFIDGEELELGDMQELIIRTAWRMVLRVQGNGRIMCKRTRKYDGSNCITMVQYLK